MSFEGAGFAAGLGGGRGSSAAGAPNGLPFSGVPSEMQDGLEELLKQEPDHVETALPSPARQDSGKPLSLLRMLRPYVGLALLATALMAVVSVANQAGPRLVVRAIDDGMVRQRSMAVLTAVTGVYLAATILSSIAQYGVTRVTGRLASNVMHDLRVRVFCHLQRLSLDFYTREKAGVVMTRMTSDIENLQAIVQDGLAQIVVQALTMVIITVVLLTMNAQLAVLTIAISVPPLIAITVWFRNRSADGYERVRDGIAAVLADLSESLRGVRVITATNRAARNVVAHERVLGTYRNANSYTARAGAVYAATTQTIGYVCQATLLGVGGHMVVHHTLTLGELVAFFLYLNRFFAPIQLLVQQFTAYQQANASVLKLRTLLDEQPNVQQTATATELPTVQGDVTFDRVTFGYDPAVPVVQDVTLHLRAGQSVAVVGATGAGKSSLAKLVMRLYDPTNGSVRIDGTDLRTVTLDSLRRQVLLVPQEPFLFAGTLRDNITFGAPGASDEDVVRAIDAIGLSDLVQRLPEGLDSLIHERGDSLASGERQLIVLARAFLARPRVLVLDEATANLDLATERQVEQALDTLLASRTAILIAHRLSTARKADRIVVMAAGRVVEEGTHDELVAAAGRYAGMYAEWERSSHAHA